MEGDGDGYDDHQLPHGAGQDLLPYAAQDQGDGPLPARHPPCRLSCDSSATRTRRPPPPFYAFATIDMMRAAVGQPLAEDTLEALYSLR